MTLSEALKQIKKILVVLFIEREQEKFSYVRDVEELTDSTSTRNFEDESHIIEII